MSQLQHTKCKGFTLIELIAVLVILGIIAGFAIPRFATLRDNAESASLEGVMAAAVSQCSIEHARLVLDPTLAGGGATVSNIATNAANNVSYDSVKFQAPDFAANAGADTITITVNYNSGQGSATIAPVIWEQP
ncbi:prepilin-type N-terminal cleavage/methylation domain-containing protein [Desulfovibrio ferrophilus]|uniref:Type II secretory pathway, pseudopilin PulG n=1 Tax=Desulfovibrio ferrophilus TaxID=241368 RepID=A0A2Z6AZB2_9BACT|nr:prepilin-type N-terminal cleavage/methylation domain-containing protein [Desulfovibrio ferrophilus]BBD08525.1 type II secretory pathway, pseudopilin PulG [Desulfovibrio ferrophilus]